MSFIKKIENMRNKPPKEKKFIVLFATSLIFLIVVAGLYSAGAFSIGRIYVPVKSENITSMKEDVSSLVDDAGESVRKIKASSSEFMDEFDKLSSTTTSTTTPELVNVDGATTSDHMLTATSSDEVLSGEDPSGQGKYDESVQENEDE